MAGELERLLVRLEADTTVLRRALTESENGVTGFASNTERSLSRTKKTFGTFEQAITSGLLKVAGAFGAVGLASKAFEAVGAAGEVNDMARAAALSTDTFQAYAFAAREAGTDTEIFAKASQRFAVNMAQVRAETGGFNSFLEAHLPKLAAQLRATKDQDEAFRLVANAVASLKSEEDRTTLATEAFGKAGGDLVEILAKGSAGLAEATAKARELGIIQSGEVLDSAELLKKQYAALAAQIEATWQRAVVGVAGYISQIKLATDATAKVGPGRSAAAFSPATASAASPASGGFAGIGSVLAGRDFSKQFETALRPDPGKIGEWTTEVATKGEEAIADLNRQLVGSTADAFDDIQLEYDQDLAKFEALLSSKEINDTQYQEARIALQQVASNKIAAAMKDEAELARQHFAEIEALISNTFMSEFSNALDTGEFKAKEFFASLLKGFAELTARVLILKPLMDGLFGAGGVGSSLFGALGFGGARAAGGPVSSGKPYLVGERGPELFVPTGAGRVMSHRATTALGGGATTVYNIDARGADIGVAERIERALAMSERSRRDPVSSVAKQSRRFPTRSL